LEEAKRHQRPQSSKNLTRNQRLNLVNKWNLDQKGLEKRRVEREEIILEKEEEMGEEEALLKAKQEKRMIKERRQEIAARIAKLKQKEINRQRQLEKERKEKVLD
jgi:hypothetical protein